MTPNDTSSPTAAVKLDGARDAVLDSMRGPERTSGAAVRVQRMVRPLVCGIVGGLAGGFFAHFMFQIFGL